MNKYFRNHKKRYILQTLHITASYPNILEAGNMLPEGITGEYGNIHA